MSKPEKEWKTCLSPEEYHILREKGTEVPFTGKYVHNKKKGMYVCAGCGAKLFSSDTKYDSGTGWPSFWKPSSKENVEMRSDNSLFMQRTEVLCKKCGGHLGHLFDDGSKPTGKRFCINSAALHFKEKKIGEIIIYSLTPVGRRVLDVAKKRFVKTFVGIYTP